MARTNDHSFKGLLDNLTSRVTLLERRSLSNAVPARLGQAGATVPNWDFATMPGFYNGAPGTANAPEATGNYAGITYAAQNGDLVQVVFNADATPATALPYVRTWNGTTWSAWARNNVLAHTHAAADVVSGVFADARLPARIRGQNVPGGTINADTLVESGWYGASLWTNTPANGIAAMRVDAYSADWIAQTFYQLADASGRIYTRIRHSGTTWTAWFETARQGSAGVAFRSAAGTVPVTSSINTGTGVNAAVTFPVGLFTQVPVLVPAPGSSARLQVAVTAISTSGATVRIDNHSGATAVGITLPMQWIALQMDP